MCKNTKPILFSVLFVFCLALESVSAQSTTQSTETQTQESQSPTPTLIEIAQLCKDESTMLSERLELRKSRAQAQVEIWQTIVNSLTKEKETAQDESTELSGKLAKAEAELVKSQTALTEISKSLGASKAGLIRLSKDFEDYKKASEDKIAKQKIEIMVYKGIGITISIAGTVYAGYVIGHSYKLW
jgi:chromosome segregation ATPase